MELKDNHQFNIDCCNACGEIIIARINHRQCKKSVINKLKKKYNMEISTDELYELAKSIYKDRLANDKYGVNNLKEVVYAQD